MSYDLSNHLKKSNPPELTTSHDKPASDTRPYRASEITILNGCDLNPEPIRWLWPGWLATGKLHILGGAPGTGKTTLALAMAATVTTGGNWPDGKYSLRGNVVIWSGEDDPADTLMPRLLLSGVDPKRVFFVGDVLDHEGKRGFDPAKDMRALSDALDRIGDVRLLIVDSIVSAVAGDSHKNGEVRRALAPLVELAGRVGCALLGITHFSKGTAGRDPTERITGSLAFGALARLVMVAAKHQEQDGDSEPRRVLLRAKSNIGRDDGGFVYELQQSELANHPGVVASCAVFGEAIEGAARDILAEADATDADAGGDTVSSVVQWLGDLLTDEGGELDRREVMKAANAMGFKERTVHRARESLGLIVDQTGFGKSKRSVWKKSDNTMRASIVPCVPDKKAGKHGIHGSEVGTHESDQTNDEVII
jgi:putative DNA primase/helicase